MEKLADISVFENLQNAANRSMASQMSVFNSFSESEKQLRTEWFTDELNELRKEAGAIAKAAEEADMKMSRQDYWHAREVIDRVQTLEERLNQLKSKDTEGAFIDKCLDIESYLNMFKTRIKGTVDTPPEKVKGLRNAAMVD